MKKGKNLSVETKIAALKTAVKLIQSGAPAGLTWTDIGKQYGAHRSTLLAWFSKVKGAPVEEWHELLEPHYQSRGFTAKLTDEAWEYFLNYYREMSNPSSTSAYKATVIEAKSKDWTVPSCRTLQRRLNHTGQKRDGFSERYGGIKL